MVLSHYYNIDIIRFIRIPFKMIVFSFFLMTKVIKYFYISLYT